MCLCGDETAAKVDRFVWYTVFGPIETYKREADLLCYEYAHRNYSEIEAGNFNMFFVGFSRSLLENPGMIP